MFEVILVNDTRLQIDGTSIAWRENRVEIWTELPEAKSGFDKLVFAAPINGVLAIQKVELTNGSVGNA